MSLLRGALFTFVNILSTNLIYAWYYIGVIIRIISLLVIVNLLVGSTPYVFILGVNLFYLFLVAFSFWFCSFISRNYLLIRFYYVSWGGLLGLFLFDMFVVLLRPVTLTLRILINVTLGHTLIILLNLDLFYFIFFVWFFELFVYLIQSYVFLTLCKGYLEPINCGPSLLH